MSTLIPNLPGLMDRLDDGTDARLIADAFDADTVEAARVSLRQIVEGWEKPSDEADAMSPETLQ
mgnify:FL=1